MSDPSYVADEPPDVRRKYGVSANAICKRLHNFVTGMHALQPAHRAELLGTFVPALQNPDAVMYIVGHASRLGKESSNQILSGRRANEVKTFVQGKVDLSKARQVNAFGEGETAARGRTENDPIDRAVVVIVQPGSAPPPDIIRPPPKTDDPPPKSDKPPDGTDGTTPLPIGFGLSGWYIDGISGIVGSVPTPIPGLNVGGGVQFLTLENKATNELAEYRLTGALASLGTTKIPGLGKILEKIAKFMKGHGIGIGPSFFPTYGTRIVVTPWVSAPVKAEEFACFATIISGGGGLLGTGSGNAIVFSYVPLVAILGVIGPATIKGIGAFASTGLGAGVSGDVFYSKATLLSVKKKGP